VTRVLVTGAGSGLGNNVIRSLRAAEPALVVVGCHADRFLLKKSDADVNYLVPPAHAADHVAALRRVVARERVALVVPTSDHDVRVVSRQRRRLGARVFLPRHPVIELCQDKYRVSAYLRARGVPAPRTLPLRRGDDVARLFRRLPPGRAWCRIRRGSGSYGAAPVDTPAQARAWLRLWREMRGVPATEFSLCEYLPGRDFGCQSVWDRGRMVLAKTFERLAYFGGGSQPSGVSSVASLARSVVEPAVVDVCRAAVTALDPRGSGLYCIDLKADAAGVPHVTDVNVGRFSLTTGLYDLIGKHSTAELYLGLGLGRPVEVADPYDVAPDHYLVRDVDTVPSIVHAEQLFEGITDLR
jgi:glutathione synthase/RimK-type ligase-like ATP-grasp enzyme